MRFIIFFILLIAYLPTTFAAEPKCINVPLTIEGNNITLPGTPNPKAPIIYFFQNKSLQSLWIDHPDREHRGASAGWASYLRPGNWSAIVLNKKNFSVSCSMIQPGKVVPLNCAKTLSVCTFQNITSAKPLEGNYWLAEDKKWESVLHILKKREIDIH